MNHLYKKMNQKGFTLIELLIVVSIISFLASTFFPTMNEARAKAEDARRIASLKNIQTQIADQTNIGQLPYSTVFSDGEVSEKIQRFLQQTGVAQATVDMKADVETYALVFPLQKGGFWCVDSEGASKYVVARIADVVGPYSCALAVSPTDGPGSIDDTFIEANVNGPIYHGLIQPDGKIILEGNFTSYNSVPTAGFVRLNSDGTVDTTFTANALTVLGIPNLLEAVHLTSNGKILIGGSDIESEQSQLRRLNSDGTIDATFNATTPVYGLGNAIESYSNDSTPIYDIDELNDGTIVTARGTKGVTLFDSVTGEGTDYRDFNAGAVVSQIAVISATNEIVAGGSFSSYEGVSASNIVWMSPSGAPIDNNSGAFDVGAISDIFVDASHGKLYVLGGFAGYAGNSARGIVALEYDGTYLGAFDTAVGFNNAEDPNLHMIGISIGSGKPVVAGLFDSYDNCTMGNIARINADGSCDEPSPFDGTNGGAPVYGFTGGDAHVILIQSDGKMVVAGAFTTYKGESVGKVVRLNP